MPLLEFDNVTKSFFGVPVLHGVSFELEAGQVLGLVGENGSGKSTSMNILGGVLPMDKGSMRLNGQPYAPRKPRDATARGIAFIHQELNLFDNLTIEENIFIDRFPRRYRYLPLIDRREIRARTRSLLESVDIRYSPTTLVNRLSPGERQLVEIAKALSIDARIIILDEPTTSLTQRETEKLFQIIQRLRSRGISMIYISHHLSDVLRLCDQIVVLRDGAVVGGGTNREMTPQEMISLLVGRTIEQMYPMRDVPATDQPVLEVRGLTQPGIVEDISFALHAGEVLGVAGLMGSGRSELARILFGLDPYREGTIQVKETTVDRLTPRRCMDMGMAFVTEDRRAEGLLFGASVGDNVALASLAERASGALSVVDQRRLVDDIARVSQDAGLKVTHPWRMLVRHLSGGNQQKAVLAKWLLRRPDVFLLDEPTRGIDVGAKHEIYSIINQLVTGGAGVLLISSEMEELIGMCDRILVMSRGEITAVNQRLQFDSQQILQSAMGSRLEGME